MSNLKWGKHSAFIQVIFLLLLGLLTHLDILNYTIQPDNLKGFWCWDLEREKSAQGEP